MKKEFIKRKAKGGKTRDLIARANAELKKGKTVIFYTYEDDPDTLRRRGLDLSIPIKRSSQLVGGEKIVVDGELEVITVPSPESSSWLRGSTRGRCSGSRS
tara:strand:- start:42 stop:344 length:303 start_codon:yes stop_codon:yes gene_type:complete